MALADQLAQGVQFAAPIDPFAQYGKMQQLQAGQTQNALAQYQLGAAQRADEVNTNFLRGIQSAGSNEDAIRQAYQNAGKIKEYQDYQKSLAESGKLKAETTNLGYTGQEIQSKTATDVLGRQLKTAEIAGSVLNGVKDQETYDQAKRALSHLAPDAVKDYPDVYDPKFIASEMAMGQTLTQKLADQVAQGNLAVNRGQLGVSQGNLAVNQGNLAVNQGRLGVEKAGLSIRAIQADPYNISGVQAAFPVPGASVSGTPSSTDKQPSGAPVVQNAAAAMKAGLVGEDLLTHLPTPLASQVRAIGEGRQPSPAARSLTTPAGRQLMDLVNAAYPNYDAKEYATMGTAEKAFTSGKKGDTTRSLNVAVDHLGTLQQVADALQNGDTRLFNQAGNFIALQTGNQAPTDFNAVKRIVADEVTKAVLGSGGALGDRKAADDAINSANSPAQLKGVIDNYKKLMGGQLAGIEQQYTASTGKKDFRNRFLTPTTQAALGNSSAASSPAAATGGVDTSNKWLK